MVGPTKNFAQTPVAIITTIASIRHPTIMSELLTKLCIETEEYCKLW